MNNATPSTKPSPAYRIWTREEVEALLQNDRAFLQRALVVLYNRQTSDEQVAKSTKHQNGRGFNSGDAKHLTRAAGYVLAGRNLNPEHAAEVLKRIVKYAGQLTEHANAASKAKHEAALAKAAEPATHLAYAKVSCEEAV